MPVPRSALRSTLAIVLAFVACGTAITPAHAAPAAKAMWGPVAVDGVSQFPLYKQLGVDLYETTIYWNQAAPTKPADATNPTDAAYRWDSDVDQAVAEAQRNGMQVSIMVTQTPGWANGGQPGNVPPRSAQDYARFVEAIARRYPSVRDFQVWGEPIRQNNWKLSAGPSAPNYYVKPGDGVTDGLPRFSAGQKRDAQRYAKLVDATYGRLKALNRKNVIIGGNTTTSGEVDPFNWIRYMRLPNGKPPRMDMFGHNPFGTRQPDLSKPQILAGTADFSDLDVLIPWIDRWMHRDGRNRRLPLFIAEYNAPTDVPSYEFPYYVTRAVQAKWLRAAFRIADRPSSRIAALGWISLYDMPVRPDGSESHTGLIDAQGVRKPAFDVYESAP